MNPETRRSLTICGWEIGFERFRFIKMLRKELGIGLSETKAITDSVLHDKHVELPVGDRDHAFIADRARALGARVLTPDGDRACP